jgi:hypothetical protein
MSEWKDARPCGSQIPGCLRQHSDWGIQTHELHQNSAHSDSGDVRLRQVQLAVDCVHRCLDLPSWLADLRGSSECQQVVASEETEAAVRRWEAERAATAARLEALAAERAAAEVAARATAEAEARAQVRACVTWSVSAGTPTMVCA